MVRLCALLSGAGVRYKACAGSLVRACVHEGGPPLRLPVRCKGEVKIICPTQAGARAFRVRCLGKLQHLLFPCLGSTWTFTFHSGYVQAMFGVPLVEISDPCMQNSACALVPCFGLPILLQQIS
eukprot:1051950-Alexandrium_andersonii.AAC.1